MDLYLTIPGEEFFDQENNVFIKSSPTNLILRHTLVSLSEWESKYEKTFLAGNEKTPAEIFDYIRMMSSAPIDDSVFRCFDEEATQKVADYIKKPHSATRLSAQPGGAGSHEKITSELIYYWMIALNIPWEAQYWHLERLLTLIDVVQRKNEASNAKSSKGKNANEIARQRRVAAAANRARYNSKG